ncbi:hypothetical protein tinsulaeT_06840 [Thalassotalea insulae]|uniref:DUF2268 domain-containing protein n=1 Tax=Thalassotalea insulae TaxID=2056778 RepID=A0ABQ6GPV6_9GAMM|nr:DUF5700 domain-containing putative Zn-dependent protease [Thalassotalea insulae]GLX77344.1 hypothetical protein tinsulaeT_06840 [Thalassotalea insulae]
MNFFIRKRCLCAIITLTVFSATAASSTASGDAKPTDCNALTKEQLASALAFEFGDMDKLWKIIDQLKSGSDPLPEQWNSLASGPGYESLIKEEIPKDVLLEAIRTAFLPSKQTQQKQWREQGKAALRLVEHFIELDLKRREVTNLLLQLKQEQGTLSQHATELACGYFSHPAGERWPRFSVAFAAFQKDARGYSSSIVMDPLFALEAGDNLVYWLAHETHHILRHTVTVSTTRNAMSATNESLVWVLHQLQSEGIGDQIDKRHTFFNDGYLAHSKFAKFFRDEVTNAPARIAELDVLIRDLQECQQDCDTIDERIRETAVMAGHPLGFFMAETIDRTLGREALLADIGNPAQFLVSYNRAALKSSKDLPLFSDSSLEYVLRLFTDL